MALTVRYSPDFTGDCYQSISSGECLLGYTSLANAGLLEFLELRLGLPSESPTENARVIKYSKALSMNVAGSFYEDSFKLDPLGTAATILGWRDTLLMAGWDAFHSWTTPRLEALSVIERTFDSGSCPGASDRWLKVLLALSAGNPFSVGDKIEVHAPKEIIPKVISDCLDALGTVVDWSPGIIRNKKLDISGKNASIMTFPEYSDALEWVSGQTFAPGTAIINRDGMRLNAVLRRHQLPQVSGRLDNSNPGTPQIFILGLSLLTDPLNAHNLLSYLQLPKMPLPPNLARELARALLRDNGLGETWDAVPEIHMKNLSATEKKEVAYKLDRFLFNMLKSRCADGQVSVEAAKSFCKDVSAWARAYAASHEDSPERPFFGVLASECDDMLILLSGEGELMDAELFNKYIRQIYSPSSLLVDKACLGGLPVVRTEGNIIDSPEHLVWLSCNGDLENGWPYAFLSAPEKTELKNIPEKSVFASAAFVRMVDKLNAAAVVTLCESNYDCGEALREHPAVTLFRKAGVPEQKMASKTWEGPVSSFTPRQDVDMGMDMLGDFRRTESPTSIDKLTEYPFDYYLENVLGLWDASATVLKDENLTIGLVAHLAFKELVEDGHYNMEEISSILNRPENGDNSLFMERVRRAATKVGAPLLLPSSTTLFKSFCGTLRKSLDTLLELLKRNNLTPFKCEEQFDEDLGGELGQVRGSVDFIAKTSTGDLVIIDFKYSTGKAYIEKLREDTSVQLEVYSLAMEKKFGLRVVATGYWLFKVNELHTCCNLLGGPHVIVEQKKVNPDSLRQRMENSMLFRRDEFRSGHFEILEGYEVAGTPYYEAAGDEGLLALPVDGKRNPVKKYVSSSVTITAHEVLKDNLI